MAELLIRRAEPSDAEAVARIFEGTKVLAGTLQLPFPGVELWRARLSQPPEGVYVLVACVGDEVVGQLGLHTNPSRPRRKHAAGIGMAVRDDWQGKGVGTALLRAAIEMADKWLNISRLELEVFIDNEPGIRLYKKMGFVVEGTLRQYAFRNGEYVDTLSMARLRSEDL